MNRNEVWQQIKNDKSLIYGKPMIDVFLQLTKTLSAKHFLELNKEQIEKLNLDTIIHVLWTAKDVEKVSEMLGPQAFNKLDSGQINYILKVDKDFYSAEDTKDKKAQTFTRTDAILKYRDLNSTDVSNLLLSIDDKNDLEKMLSTIGKDKLKTLDAEHVSYLIRYYLNNKFGPFAKQDGFEIFKIFVQALGEHINILRPKDVWEFINYETSAHCMSSILSKLEKASQRIEEILDLIGNENLKKLTNDQLEDFRQQGLHFKQETDIAQYYQKLVTSIKKRRLEK